jgi:hypothetical protein
MTGERLLRIQPAVRRLRMTPPNLSPAPVTPSSVWEQLGNEAQQQVISLVAQLALKWLSGQADQTHQAVYGSASSAPQLIGDIVSLLMLRSFLRPRRLA